MVAVVSHRPCQCPAGARALQGQRVRTAAAPGSTAAEAAPAARRATATAAAVVASLAPARWSKVLVPGGATGLAGGATARPAVAADRVARLARPAVASRAVGGDPPFPDSA